MKVPSSPSRITLLLVLFIIVSAVWLVGIDPVFAQPTIPHPVDGREDCLSCHAAGESGAPRFPDDHDGRTNESCVACHMEGLEQNPPVMPHPLENREQCLACHQDGIGGAPEVPADHEGRITETCLVCHTPAMTEDAPYIPHTLEGREACLACHSPGSEDISEAAQEPEVVATEPPPPPEPLSYPELEGDTNSCFICHIGQEGMIGIPARNWQNSIHARRGVICADCHGGNPNAMTKEEAMSPDVGFIGKPSRTDIPDLCGGCHANVTMMRQYDLPTDQYAKYQESQHGQLLAQGDIAVATCFDCHDQHSTYETNDPKSSVYPLNVPELCGRCHADEDYMAGYDIPTNQFDLYKESVHGEALLDEQNTRAPNCATCHGTHGAAPPGFEEVANVCGSCHTATQDYYLTSAHNNSDDEDAPLCVTCHGRYDVQKPSEAMFEGGEPRHCGACHASDSEAGTTVVNLQNALVTADEALRTADETVEQAARLGMIVAEEESLMTEARTRLITARAAQHTVDEDVVITETDASIELSNQATNQAAQAIQQSRFRRLAMIIALAVIMLIIVSLILLRRELISRRAENES